MEQTESGEEALELLRHYEYDIVLLDVPAGYRGVRGRSAHAGVSQRHAGPDPVGRDHPQARVKALGLGADDFITKPFDKAELLARMQAIVRRSKGFSQPTVRFGAWNSTSTAGKSRWTARRCI